MAGHPGGADDAAVVAERGTDELEGAAGGRQRDLRGAQLGAREDGVGGFDHAAADDDALGVDERGERTEAGAEVVAGLGQDVEHQLIAGLLAAGEHLGADDRLVGLVQIAEQRFAAARQLGEQHARDGGARCVGFEVAAPAAATKAAAVLDDGVADLTSGAGGAVPERAVADDGTADASADEDADEALAATSGAVVLLAIGADLDVVAEHDGEVEAVGELVADGHVYDAA